MTPESQHHTARDPHKEPPIRIIRKKDGHGGHHGGAWKVAYADFVTAMMALFIVLWIVGQSKQVREYVANYFKDPGAFFENTSGGGMNQGPNVIPLDESSILDSNLKREKEKMQEMAEKIKEEMNREVTVQNLADQVKIEIVEEGLRIELLEGSESFFFDIGSSRLKSEAVKILTIIAKQIGKLNNAVVIEGHTDGRKYARSASYTNFELSVDRANSARRILVTHGLQDARISEIRGYADRHLRNAGNSLDITNRRISIIIQYAEPQS